MFALVAIPGCEATGPGDAPANRPPVAQAGRDTSVIVGTTVQLDGKASVDPDGDTLRYEWELLSIPAGSAGVLSVPNAVNPSFVADAVGAYLIQLIVRDGSLASAPDSVTVTAVPPPNSAPVADAGEDAVASVGDAVQLDGSASSDGDGDALTYQWTMLSRPLSSLSGLSNAFSIRPSFVADVPGTYRIMLVVHDGKSNSAPDSVTVSAVVTSMLMHGDLVADSINAAGQAHYYMFDAAVGERWLFSIGEGGSFVGQAATSLAILLNPAGDEIGRLDGTSQRQLDLVMPGDGPFTIRIQATNAIAAGLYWFGLERIVPIGPVEGMLAAGDLVAGSIVTRAEVDLYTFTAVAGERWLFSIGEGGSFVGQAATSLAILLNPAGDEIGRLDGTSQRQLDLVMPGNGPFTIRIQATNAIASGLYWFGLERIVPIGPVDGGLEAGDTVSGSIATRAEVDLYTFTGAAGQQWTFALSEGGGFVGHAPTSLAIVMSPAGDEIGRLDGTHRRQLTVTLPSAGRFIVRIQATDAISTGSYQFLLNRIP